MRPLRHVKQPWATNLCGHTCIAIVLGITLDEACTRIGHRHAARTRDLVRCLGNLTSDTRLQRNNGSWPHHGILKIRWSEHYLGHYVVKCGRKIHDPLFDEPMALERWRLWLQRREGKVTSFLTLALPGGV